MLKLRAAYGMDILTNVWGVSTYRACVWQNTAVLVIVLRFLSTMVQAYTSAYLAGARIALSCILAGNTAKWGSIPLRELSWQRPGPWGEGQRAFCPG